MEEKIDISRRVTAVGFMAILLALTIYLLSITQTLAIPFVIALFIFYLFSKLSKFTYRKISKIKRINKISKPLSSILTIVVILYFILSIYGLINDNISRLVNVAPKYEKQLTMKFAKIKSMVSPQKNSAIDKKNSGGVLATLYKKININSLIPKIPDIGAGILKNINIPQIISALGGLFTSLAKNTTLISIYLLFIAIESGAVKKKYLKLCENNHSVTRFGRIAKQIDRSLITYLKVKSGSSLLTAIASFLILLLAGVDFASFWALLIFILNFIPTIGSIIAVLFPITLSIIQFDSFPAVIVTGLALTSVQLVIGNIIEPRYLGKTLNLSPLVILASLAIWGKIWGVLGMFLSVPIMVSINILLAQFESTRYLAIILSSDGHIPNAELEDSK